MNKSSKGKVRPKTSKRNTLVKHKPVSVIRVPSGTGFTKVKGKGDYTSEGIGSWLGSKLGGMAGRLFKSVTGIGDYSIAASKTHAPPIFNDVGSPIIEHREFITDILSSTDFNINAYPINPGLLTTFPWLGTTAINFEQYQIVGLIFEYISTSANALDSINTALGTVIMATEYDVEDATFTSKLQMENHTFASSAKPSMNQLHAVECDPRQTPVSKLFVRGGAVPTGADGRLYDLGIFELATVGMQQAGVTIGELWCTYKIRLIKPALGPIVNATTPYAHLYSNAATTVTNTNFFPTMVSTPQSNLAVTTTAASVIFPTTANGGTFLVCLNWKGTAGANITYPGLTYSACTPLGVFNQPTNADAVFQNPFPTASSSRVTLMFILSITGSSASINLGTGLAVYPTFGAGSSVEIYVAQVPATADYLSYSGTRKGVSKSTLALLERLEKLERLSLPSIKEVDESKCNNNLCYY